MLVKLNLVLVEGQLMEHYSSGVMNFKAIHALKLRI